MHTVVILCTIILLKRLIPICFGSYWSIIMEYVNYYCIKQLFYTIMYSVMMDH